MAHYTRGHSELIVGGLLVAAIVVFGTLFAIMTDRNLETRRSDLYVAIPTAHGLVKGDAVLYRGVNVGEVRGIDYTSHSDAVIVFIRIKRPVPLRADASATLSAVDLFGRQSMVLDEGTADELPIASGDTIQGFSPPTITGRVEGLSVKAERFMSDTTIELIHGLLAGGESTMSGLRTAVRHTDRVITAETGRIEKALEHIIRLSDNLASATDSIEVRRIQANLELATANLVQLTASMDSTSVTLRSVLHKLDRGDGTAARLLNDPLLYENATVALSRLDALLLDIKQNPRRYINVRIF